MRQPQVKGDWVRIMALAADGYGWEDIVVIMQRQLLDERRGAEWWTPEQVRNYVLKTRPAALRKGSKKIR